VETKRSKSIPNRKQTVGRWGERTAEQYMLDQGYEVIERNYRSPYGEIDLIVRRGDEFVFAEVKTRTSRAFGMPEEAITPKKKLHLIHAVETYLQAHPEIVVSWRIDVIAIFGLPNHPNPEIVCFENAVY